MMHHQPPAHPTAAVLSDVIQEMPLPDVLKQLLTTGIHPVPAAGLFACSTSPLPEDVACPRQDVVQALLAAAKSQPHAFVACVGGRRRQGKSFSNPWAQLEAIRLLESQPGHQAARSGFLFYLSCLSQDRSEPTVYEQILLLAALVRPCSNKQHSRTAEVWFCAAVIFHVSAQHPCTEALIHAILAHGGCA